ncbi:MAG: sensor histidine kinase [Acidimicrobiia bacterium]
MAARTATSPKRLQRAVAAEWRELGWLGRVALLGVAMAAVLTLFLGTWIPASVRHHLLSAQTDSFEAIAHAFTERDLVPLDPNNAAMVARFDDEVRFRLLGGQTVRVKLWSTSGEVIYSDASQLVGQQFPLSKPAMEALAGEPSFKVSNLDDPAHAIDREYGKLIEYYIPIVDDGNEVVGAFEVEQTSDILATHLGRVRRNVWLSIGIGLGLLALFVGSLVLAWARTINRRRRMAENLLGQMARAREAERRRIVGALHGDIGQPLYRLLYGLEGSRGKVDRPGEIDRELQRLTDLVREIDATLRTELKRLHHSEVEDVGLEPALQELAAATRTETELDFDLDVELNGGVAPAAGSALFWAAEEGVINARKHAQATLLQMRVTVEDGIATLTVHDDGVGVSRPEGLGLVTVRERLDNIGGGLAVESHRGVGTVLKAWVPADAEAS